MASPDCRLPAHLGHSVGRLSRGKTRDLPPTYPPHLQPSVRVAIGLQRPVPPRPPPAASYAVRVPRAGSPPTAAFPLHPCHAGAVRLGVPTTRVSGGTSTPLVTSRSAFASRSSDVLTDVGAPCPAHTEKSLHRPRCRLWKRADATTAWRESPRSPGSGPPRPWRRSTCRPPSPRSGRRPLATGSAVRGRLSSFVSGYQPPDRRLACRNLKNCSIGFRSCRSSVILSVWDA